MNFNNIYWVIGAIATILSVIAFIPYFKSIIQNKTRPSGASWWTWSIITIITVLSSRTAGASWEVLMLPIWLCVSQLVVAILSIKKGDNNWDVWNKMCVVGALSGMGIWLITGEPLIALIISVIADLLASIPNFRHTFTNPEQEDRLAWTLGFGSAILELFAIQNWSLAESSWAIYFALNMTIVLLLVWRPILKKN